MDFMVGNTNSEINGNINTSNVTEKLVRICGLCNRQFFPDLLFGVDESQGFNAENVLHAFIADKSQDKNDGHLHMQMCFTCKTHFKNLMIQKEILSRLIDEITNFIQQNSPLTALKNSKKEIVSKLFEIGRFPYLVDNSCSINNLPVINQFEGQISELDPQDLEQQLNSIVVTFVPEQQFVQTGIENFAVILVNPESESTKNQFEQSFHTEVNLEYSTIEANSFEESIVSKTLKSINYNDQGELQELVNRCAQSVDDLNSTDSTSNFKHSSSNVVKMQTTTKITEILSSSQVQVKTTKEGTTKKKAKKTSLFCSICSKLFNSKSNLTAHITGSHTNERMFICEICGLGYRHKLAFETHLALHRGEAKFECEQCKKVFTQKSGLKRHLTIHTGEKAYNCEICQKQFRYHTSFNIHKLTHKGNKEHECVSCSQSFISKSHLRRHEKVHTGYKPYKCDICSKHFTEKYNLDVHKKTHSGTAAHPCKLCEESFQRKRELEVHITKSHTNNDAE